MTEKAKEYIQPFVRLLIKCVAHVEPGADRFSHLEQYVFSNIWGDKFNTVDRYATKKSFDGVIKKFFIHGHTAEAEKLQSLLDKYLSSKDWENDQQQDTRWYILSLLLHLSYNPTGFTAKDPQVVQTAPVEKNDEFDWPAYLLENQPDFISLGSGGSETEDECLSLEDELQGECSSLTEDINTEPKSGGSRGGGPPEATENDVCRDQLWKYIEDTTTSAHSWLEEHVQLPSVQECKVSSKFASANLAEFCDSVANTVNEQPTVVMSEYRVLREALSALQVPPDPNLSSQNKGLFFTDHRCLYRPQGTLTIPSLTKGSLQTYLSWIGSYVSKVREIEKFISEMSDVCQEDDSPRDGALQDPQGEKDCCLPPLTYEAYASALREFILSFKEKVLAIEEKVKSQDDVCTMLSVAEELRPAFMELELVHRVHLDAVSSWKESSNWLCSCRLLTVLYGALLSSFSNMGASLCLHLFMKAFQPYLEIIHVWLIEGRLEDWREEFIISKNEFVCCNTENFWKEGFILCPYEEELSKVSEFTSSSQPLGLLHLIRDKVLPLGKNMELLQRLDHLSEVQRSLPSFERSLYHELINVLKTEMKDEVPDDGVVKDEAMTCSPTTAVDCDLNSVLKTLVQRILGNKDYYLRMAFGDVSCLNGNPPSPLSCKPEEGVWRHWGMRGSSGMVPLRVEWWLGKLLEERHGMSSAIVRTLLVGEFSLVSHLLVVRKVFLMEEGDSMQHFCTYLFMQAENGEEWVDTLSLTNHLYECISNRSPDVASNFSVLTSLCATSSSGQMPSTASSSGSTSNKPLEQVDHITINYEVQWPVNIVLNAASMESYNAVFQFLLKVKWALWSLQQLRFCDLKPSQSSTKEEVPVADDTVPMCAKVHRLQLLRAWLLHFVGSVHAYLMGQVLHVLGIKMEVDLESACNLDSIIQVHENYLELINQQCLQTKNSQIIKMAIIRVLDISMYLCHLWKQPTRITPQQLYDMESQYIRHHVFLARVLENAMNRGYLSHLKALVSALAYSFPSH